MAGASLALSAALLACPSAPERPAPPHPPPTAATSAAPTASSVRATAELDASVAPAPHPRALPGLAVVDQCVVPRTPAQDAGIPMDFDIPYGPDERQRVDIAWPEGKPKGLVVLIHGGGWTAGYKALFRPTARTLASLGYVAATVGYRMARDDARAFPVGLADVRCGIRLAMRKAHERGAIRTALLGASAGAHLAVMVDVAGDAQGFDGDCPEKGPIHVDGTVAYYPPLDIEHSREHYPPRMQKAVDELLRVDGGPAEWMAHARAATPANYVDSSDPPILLLHGHDDPIVPVQDSRDFERLLRRAHVPTRFVEVPGEKHGFFVLGRRAALRRASCTALRFLEVVLGP